MIFINGVSFQSETLKNPKIFLFQKKLVIVLQSHFINQTPSFQREASVFFLLKILVIYPLIFFYNKS